MSMRIVAIRPVPKGAGKTIARFDLEVEGGLRMYGLVLREHSDGARAIAGPQFGGRRFATFLPDVAIRASLMLAIPCLVALPRWPKRWAA
jgi:hypothetical protein